MERRPRCYGFYVERLLVQIIHTKSKAATDFHSKGGEIQNDVWELTLGTYLGKTHENGNNRHLAQDV